MSQAGSFASNILPPGSGILTVTGDAGGAIHADIVGNINLPGAHGIVTTGVIGTHSVTTSIANTITLGDLVVVAPGSNALTITTGNIDILAGNILLPLTSDANHGVVLQDGERLLHAFGGPHNIFLGVNSGNFTLTATDAVGIGFAALEELTTGTFNVAVGSQALNKVTTGFWNVAVGGDSQNLLTTGDSNTSIGESSLAGATGASSNNIAVGRGALDIATTPADNIAIGISAAHNYTTNESNNIVIGSRGVIADSGTTRIGTAGTHVKTFITGIDGVDVGNTAKLVTCGAAGTVNQLGTATLTAGANILITPGANTITITGVGGGGAGITTITGNNGGAVPGDLAANINLLGANGVLATGVIGTNTINVGLDNSIVLGGLAPIFPGGMAINCLTGDINITDGNLSLPETTASFSGVIFIGGAPFLHGYGNNNVFLGDAAGNFTETGQSNIGIGTGVLVNLDTGDYNIGIGTASLSNVLSGTSNVAIGQNSQQNITTGDFNTSIGSYTLVQALLATGNNTALGYSALGIATGPVNNIAIGHNAGMQYVAAESDNILIGHEGVAAEVGVTRIGTNATQTTCFVAGIDGVHVDNTVKVVTMSNTPGQDQLGTATLTAGTNITITPGVNTITIDASGAGSGGVKTTIFSTPGTDIWTKDANAKYISVCIWSGGAGGDSGGLGVGGWGGGTGTVRQTEGPAMFFDSPCTVTVGVGGVGGVGGGVHSPQIPGGSGGDSSLVSASGSLNLIATGGFGGIHVCEAANTMFATPGSGTIPSGKPKVKAVGGNSGLSGQSFVAGGGGAGGSCLMAPGPEPFAPFTYYNYGFDGGKGGWKTAAVGSQPAPNGGDGADFNVLAKQGRGFYIGGDGGAGGAAAAIVSGTGLALPAGNGGKGGFPGGGGGGGGDGLALPVPLNGSGGNGGDGCVMVIEYLG